MGRHLIVERETSVKDVPDQNFPWEWLFWLVWFLFMAALCSGGN